MAGEVIRSVYTPNDVASYTLDTLEARRDGRGKALATGIGTLDRHMRPVMPGEITFVSAYTSNGKTAFMQFWARQIVRQLQARPDLTDVVVYISWETIVEELGLYDLCGMTGVDGTAAWYGDVTDEEMAALRVAAMRRAGMPLWVMGHSLKRRRELPALTMDVVYEALTTVEQRWGLRPAIVFLDYVQRIDPADWRNDRRVQVLKVVDAIQRLARDCGAPVVVGCQAGRQVLEREFKLPEIGDAQESSRIEQDADKVLSLWYPCKSEPMGATIRELGDLEVSERLMVMGIRKQRHAASGQVFPVDFDAARNTFASWEG